MEYQFLNQYYSDTNALRLLINVELLSNMLAITSNKWKSPKFKYNFNIYKKIKSEKMKGVKKRYNMEYKFEKQ